MLPCHRHKAESRTVAVACYDHVFALIDKYGIQLSAEELQVIEVHREHRNELLRSREPG